MRRHELTDEQWDLIEPILPAQRHGGRGRPPSDQRKMLNSMMWILRTGAPWRDLPERLGPWQTVYHYFNRWREDGVFDQIIEALQIHVGAKPTRGRPTENMEAYALFLRARASLNRFDVRDAEELVLSIL